jgi:hypothetical protein
MNLSESNKIQGLIPETPGILYGQFERVDELNDRILGRFYPDMPLQPNLNVRPVPTKYSHFPVIDRIPFAKVPIVEAPYYSMETNFTPSNSRGPVDGYFSNVNVESNLRNQYFAIQRGAPQNEYIPSSQSDLYNVTLSDPSRSETQPYPGLFNNYRPDPVMKVSPLDSKIGADRFFNNTRVQLRGGQLV